MPSRQDAEQEQLGALAEMCIKVLAPDVAGQAERILRYVQVSSEVDGYTSAVRLSDVAPEDREAVRRCFNAAAALDCARRVGENDDDATVLMRPMLYSMLVEFALEKSDGDAKEATGALRYGPTGLLETPVPARVVAESADPKSQTAGNGEPKSPEVVPVRTRR